MFVTLGALFSLLLSDGFSTPAAQLLMQGLGFSTGFFMIILSRAALFTKVNVIFPLSYLQGIPTYHVMATLRFWGIAWIGDILGAFIIGAVIAFAQTYPDSLVQSLDAVVAKKMAYREEETLPLGCVLLSQACWVTG